MDPATMMMLAQAGMSLLGSMNNQQGNGGGGPDVGLMQRQQAEQMGASRLGQYAAAPMLAQNNLLGAMAPNSILGQVAQGETPAGVMGGFAPMMAGNSLLGGALQEGDFGIMPALFQTGLLSKYFDL